MWTKETISGKVTLKEEPTDSKVSRAIEIIESRGSPVIDLYLYPPYQTRPVLDVMYLEKEAFQLGGVKFEEGEEAEQSYSFVNFEPYSELEGEYINWTAGLFSPGLSRSKSEYKPSQESFFFEGLFYTITTIDPIVNLHVSCWAQVEKDILLLTGAPLYPQRRISIPLEISFPRKLPDVILKLLDNPANLDPNEASGLIPYFYTSTQSQDVSSLYHP